MRKYFLAGTLLLVAPWTVAQQGMNNDAVIKMAKAGLSDQLVISSIQSQPGQYNTSIDGLIALKSAGIHDGIIAAMISKGSSAAAPTATAQQASTNVDDPNSPHEAGIWVYSIKSSGPKLVELEPSVYSQGKTGGVFASAMTYGIAKIKMKAVIRNARSNTRVNDPGAVFYFYFEQQAAGLSNASSPFGGTSTPNEYSLLHFDIKGDTRETVVGKMNAFGASSGTDDKAVVGYTYEKLRPGVYKVTPKAPLQAGEYGFISEGGGGAGPYSAGAANRVFDFGMNGTD
ncbi:MAG TPA: hypothetical protein VGD64_16730 [Acidisarcina sp.]